VQVEAWRSVGVKRGSAGKRCKCDEDVDEDAKDGVKIKKRLITTEAHEKRAHAMVSLACAHCELHLLLHRSQTTITIRTSQWVRPRGEGRKNECKKPKSCRLGAPPPAMVACIKMSPVCGRYDYDEHEAEEMEVEDSRR
jgi:hypothetical protein